MKIKKSQNHKIFQRKKLIKMQQQKKNKIKLKVLKQNLNMNI